jgi:hypothetical protein
METNGHRRRPSLACAKLCAPTSTATAMPYCWRPLRQWARTPSCVRRLRSAGTTTDLAGILGRPEELDRLHEHSPELKTTDDA